VSALGPSLDEPWATIHPMATTIETLAARFGATRIATLLIAEPLSAEDCQVQSAPFASPIKWHLAHTTWFFETFLLERAVAGYRPFHPAFRELFNSYYVGVGPMWQRLQRGVLTRPSLDDVCEYRAHVDAAIKALLARPDVGAATLARIELGLAHEEQHQELMLTDLKFLLGSSPLSPVYREDAVAAPGESPKLEWVRFEGGVQAIGHGTDDFAFDNESPRHRVFLEPYELATRPVTNGEWLAFVDDRGYSRPDFWMSDGSEASRAESWKGPLHWRMRDASRTEFTLAGEVPLDLARPVCHVSWYEADAFARWSGARLPTEFEWEHAASSCHVEGRFADSGVPHPRSSTPGSGLRQMFGDVWEWTSSSYSPYPGFRPFEGEIGEYNGKFMCNQYVLRGGSCATPRGHVRATYRNFFHPDARWQFSGVRLARSMG